jgi:hypothetical protein
MKDIGISEKAIEEARLMIRKGVSKEEIKDKLSGSWKDENIQKLFYYYGKKEKATLFTWVLIIISVFIFCFYVLGGGGAEKPVIYLYPEEKTDVVVRLDYQGKIIADYPEYDKSIKGWSVTAYPDGRIVDKRDGKEYSYIFWEGLFDQKVKWDMSTGFVVRGVDTREFLRDKLSTMGLTPKEYNEFIVYWYPQMKDNEYNLIHFAGKEYTDKAPLEITPAPDSVLRVFMVYEPLEHSIDIEEQKIVPFERKGFAVVEWGGTRLK